MTSSQRNIVDEDRDRGTARGEDEIVRSGETEESVLSESNRPSSAEVSDENPESNWFEQELQLETELAVDRAEGQYRRLVALAVVSTIVGMMALFGGLWGELSYYDSEARPVVLRFVTDLDLVVIAAMVSFGGVGFALVMMYLQTGFGSPRRAAERGSGPVRGVNYVRIRDSVRRNRPPGGRSPWNHQAKEALRERVSRDETSMPKEEMGTEQAAATGSLVEDERLALREEIGTQLAETRSRLTDEL